MKKRVIYLAIAGILAITTACSEAPEQTGTEPTPDTSGMEPASSERSSPDVMDKTKEVTADPVQPVDKQSTDYYESTKEKTSEVYESAKQKTSDVYDAAKETGAEVIEKVMPDDTQKE